MNERIVTWWIILRIALEERLVYRGDFALGTLMRFLPIITQIFLWQAIFQSLGRNVTIHTESGGVIEYTYADMVAYYLLTMMGRAFSSMPGLASGVARQVRDGEVKKFLIQAVDMIGFLLLSRIAHKLAYYSVAFLPFAFVFFVCRDFFANGWPPANVMAAFICSLILGFLLGYFLEISIGLIGFWFLEVSSLLFIYMLFSFFLSGHMFPLDMLPEPWHQAVDLLPLKYLAYFPAAIFLGKIDPSELVRELCIEASWLLFFIVFSRILWIRGTRRYSGFGG